MPDSNAQSDGHYSWLREALQNGTVLTASRRLARELRASFNEQQLSSGALAWETPRIAFWHDWAHDVLVQSPSGNRQRLLSDAAIQVVWEQSLAQVFRDNHTGLGALSRQASTTWRKLNGLACACRGNTEQRRK